jgi:N-acyl homoserine lactone hydrolase
MVRCPVQAVKRLLTGLVAPCMLVPATDAVATAPAEEVRLYTLDCGTLDFPDMSLVSDTDDYAKQSGSMAVPCFLIKHGTDWMLWDTGLGDNLAGKPGGEMRYGFRWTVRRSLRDQLAALGLKPNDVGRVGLSHTHGDHLGNIGLFPSAAILVSPIDVSWAQAKPAPPTVDPRTAALLLRAHIDPVPFDRDVFGDGTVRMLRAPGHSPGHHVLAVRLPQAGTVILAGDLWHFRKDYELSLMTAVNDSRAETLASMARIKTLAARWKGRIVIQHDPQDYVSLPKPPGYLQ